jgi:hypothetical protein
MNQTTLQHFLLFLAATWLFHRLPRWLFLGLAVLAIEADQAMAYSGWAWFLKLDTWLDILAGVLGICIVYLVEWFCQTK